ncbi:MAG TPA: metal-dependent hydrolase [Nitrososphaeraceae archaeon]|nr:metal-dependent hydrolase [Nitrososphaeraceae archaeon]
MLFIGHISLAFLLAYFISTKFQDIRKTVSIALVMFLSILPDIDILFRLAGMDLGHRTFTHGVIIWLVVGGILISFFTIKYGKGLEAAVYLIAYLSHLVIGDTFVAPINILYPFGDFIVNSPIKNGSLQHIFLEILFFTLMATIVITRYYSFKRKNEDIFLFRYHYKMDTFLYPVLILAIIISFFYVVAGFEFSLVEISVLMLLHIALVSIIMLIWLASKSAKRQERVVS